MFDGLLKSKFYSKCKWATKMTKTRIEIIRKKRNAMQKYLRNDIADLLKNGLYINAYGRMKLIISYIGGGIALTASFACESRLIRIIIALVEGLLVELNRSSCYDLIEQFSVFISSHLAAMSKQRECPEECREAVSSLMLAAAGFADLPELRELRNLFSERYENPLNVYVSKEFVEKLKSALPSKDMKLQLMQDIAVCSGLTWNSKALENKLSNAPASVEDFTEERNLRNGMNGSVQKKDCQGTENPREYTASERKDVSSYYGEKEAMEVEYRLPRRRETAVPQRDNIVRPSHETPVGDTFGRNGPQNQPDTLSTYEEKVENGKPFNYKSIPSPYTKSKIDNEENCDHDDLVGSANLKPRSVRSRHTKPLSACENVGGSQNNESVNQDKAAHGQTNLQFLDKGDGDQLDVEERMMDKLLFHYSRKKATLNMSHLGKSKSSQHGNRDAPNRLSSLPVELTSPTKTPKGHVRSTSLHPEMLSSNGHVHPKLPDYDDFVARLAAFRGN